MRWSKEDTLKFVKLYRKHECLWNVTKTAYRNRNIRQKAINNIMHEMGREGFKAKEIRQKIQNIRSTYNQELLKIRKSIRTETCSDDVYKPALKWFNIMKPIMECAKETIETQSNLVSNIIIIITT